MKVKNQGEESLGGPERKGWQEDNMFDGGGDGKTIKSQEQTRGWAGTYGGKKMVISLEVVFQREKLTPQYR